jgi:predicted nucleotidyltransferase
VESETLTRIAPAAARRRLAGAELIGYLERQPDVVAAYLFGSRARQEHTDRSDLDLAVLLQDGLAAGRVFDRRLQLMDDLARLATTPIDVVVLNGAPLLLQHEVLCDGVLILELDRAARIEFEVRAGHLYADSLNARRFFRQSLLEEIDSGGLGGRE